MRYAELKLNDVANAPGIAVSFYTQGCPHHCPKCFNPETWDFDGGKEFSYETLEQIINGLTANGVKRSLCILGGEPLCEDNEFLTNLVISSVKQKLPEGFQSSEFLLEHGFIDKIVERKDMKSTIAKLIRLNRKKK